MLGSMLWRCFLRIAPAVAVLIVPAASVAWEEQPTLAEHGKLFERQIVEVTPGVHVAVGYGLANSILIVGDDGRIIVDTMESGRAAAAVKEEFDQIDDSPVRALIYTHNHYDHVMGAAVFAGDDEPEVIAHEELLPLFERSQGALRRAMLSRNIRQFGIFLRGDDFLNAGIGPRLVIDGAGGSSKFLPPTKTVDDGRTSMTIASVDLEIVHAPGETDDQVYVWLPKQKALLCGDNFYWAFPNLYAIRGTPYRSPQLWVDSLEKMIVERPEYLIPSHSPPIEGEQRIGEILGNYRDGIRSVLEQTIAGMNDGLNADELAAQVKLPAELADLPYLQPYYGTVEWSVRAIYVGNLGWFDGNATNLFPLPPPEKARRMAELAGGEKALLEKAQQALADGDFQWAAELADYLIVLDETPGPPHSIKSKALLALGARQTSANARNYYISAARELERAVRNRAAQASRDLGKLKSGG